jgi:hypothetical protein
MSSDVVPVEGGTVLGTQTYGFSSIIQRTPYEKCMSHNPADVYFIAKTPTN